MKSDMVSKLAIGLCGLLLTALLAGPSPAVAQTELSDAEAIAPPKPEDWGMPARGNEDFDTPELLEVNMDYRFLNPLKAGIPTYFTLSGEAALTLTGSLRNRSTADPDVCTVQDGFVFLELLDEMGQVLRTVQVGEFGMWQRSSVYRPATAAKYYARLGSTTQALPADCLQFKVSAVPMRTGDLEGGDAGTDFATAIPLDYKAYSGNHLGGVDTKDGFSFYTSKSEEYSFQVDCEDPGPAAVAIQIVDENNKVVHTEEWVTPLSNVTQVFKMPQDGRYIVLVILSEHSQEIYPYSVKLNLVKGRGE